MNEELKIIIKAVTDEAKKNIAGVKEELEKTKEESSKVDRAMKTMSKGIALAVGSVAALTTAMAKLGQSAQDVNKGMSKLKSSFENAGSSAKNATKYYKELFGVLGDHDRTVETGQSLARITTDTGALSDYKNIMAGAVSQYGDGYNSEALAENISETIAAAQVTGDLERVLVEAGISAEGFNNALAQTTSLEERELLVRSTLNGILGNAGKAYIAANQATILYNESQANLNLALASAASYTTPLITSVNNLGASLLSVLSPALSNVSIYLTAFIELIAEAIQWVGGFFGIFSSGAEESKADVKGYQEAMKKYLADLKKAYGDNGASIDKNISKVKELKKQTMGFDELNVMSSQTSASTGTGGGGGGTGIKIPDAPDPSDYGLDNGGIDLDDFKKDLSEAKEHIKAILTFVAAIGAGLLIWKIADFITEIIAAKNMIKIAGDNSKYFYQNLFKEKAEEHLATITDKMKFIGGLLLVVAGAVLLVKGYLDAWVNGIDWGNFATMLAGIALIVGGLALMFGTTGAAVGLLIGGIALVVVGIKDFIENGYSMKNVLTILAGVIAVIIGAILLFNAALLANPITWIVIAIAALVAAFVILWNECEGFRNFWIGLWEKCKKLFAAFVESIKPLINAVVGAFKEAWEVIKVIWNDYLVPLFKDCWEAIKLIWNAVKPYFEMIWNNIKVIFSVVKDVLGAYFKAAWEAIKIVWNQVVSYFTAIWNTIKGIFSVVKSVLKGDWQGAWDAIKGIVGTWGNYFSNTWNNIKKIFSVVKTYFTSVFQSAWDGIKKVFGNYKKFFDGIWSNLKTGLKGALNFMIGLVNGWIKGLNIILAPLRAIVYGVAKAFGANIKFNDVKIPTIPKLATGGIVTKSTIANIGEAGREAVLPLENNTSWMDILADRIASRNSTPSRLVLMLDGKELGYATINSFNDIYKQTGNIPIMVG